MTQIASVAAVKNPLASVASKTPQDCARSKGETRWKLFA
jgi:hypothetical protein